MRFETLGHFLLACAASWALGLVGTGCVCCEHDTEDPGAHLASASSATVIADPTAIPNPQRRPPDGGGSSPRIYGHVRFQGSTVMMDILISESNPAQIDKVNVNWTSHAEGGLPVFLVDPQATFLMPIPKTRWYILSIPAAWESTANNCFHVRVEIFSGTSSMGAVKRGFNPPTDTAWVAADEWIP